jgi:16S rRNA (cytidine1402-2'-O)-methyltransferase
MCGERDDIMGKKLTHRWNENQGGQNRDRNPIAEKPAGRPENDGCGPAGTLYVVATPIGNLEDITLRAIRVLKEVRLIAAEDTRHTRILLERYQIPTPLTSLYDQNEAKKSGSLLARLQKGEDVAYVSDAGTPGISDPGFILVRKAIALGIRVAPVPGSSALIAALSVSGLPMDSFVFLGFLPARQARRRQLLSSLQQEERTLVFYESPRRLVSSLQDIDELLGEREVVVSREMTKLYEEFLRGTAGRLITDLGQNTIRGEVTLIVAGRSEAPPEYSDEDLLRCYREVQNGGGEKLSVRDMADRLARETGVSRRRIYRLLLLP